MSEEGGIGQGAAVKFQQQKVTNRRGPEDIAERAWKAVFRIRIQCEKQWCGDTALMDSA